MPIRYTTINQDLDLYKAIIAEYQASPSPENFDAALKKFKALGVGADFAATWLRGKKK